MFKKLKIIGLSLILAVGVFGCSKTDTSIENDNLKCITRKQLIKMNQNGLFYDNAELTNTGAELANLMLKINEVKKKK